MLSITEIAVMATAERHNSRTGIAQHAKSILKGSDFDERVALATLDRLVANKLIRREGLTYELTRNGREAYERSLEQISHFLGVARGYIHG